MHIHIHTQQYILFLCDEWILRSWGTVKHRLSALHIYYIRTHTLACARVSMCILSLTSTIQKSWEHTVQKLTHLWMMIAHKTTHHSTKSSHKSNALNIQLVYFTIITNCFRCETNEFLVFYLRGSQPPPSHRQPFCSNRQIHLSR